MIRADNPALAKSAEAAANNLRDAGAAIRMIRDAVQELGPVGCVRERDVGPPDYQQDAEEIIAGIQRLAADSPWTPFDNTLPSVAGDIPTYRETLVIIAGGDGDAQEIARQTLEMHARTQRSAPLNTALEALNSIARTSRDEEARERADRALAEIGEMLR